MPIRPTRYAGYKIFVAEVASTYNEILVLNYMINETNDRKEDFYLINQLAERFRTTLFLPGDVRGI